MRKVAPFALVVILSGSLAVAGEPGSYPEDVAGEAKVSDAELPTFELEMQYRPRFEHSFENDLRFRPALGSTQATHRARFGATVWYQNLRGHLSIQNARRSGTVDSEPPVALFEGFIEARGRDWGLRVGKQMLQFSTGRLLTAPVWLQRGRSLDAVRFVYDNGELAADVFAARHNERFNRDIFGAELKLRFGQFTAAMPVLVETNNLVDEMQRQGLVGEMSRVSGGFTANFRHKRLRANIETILQVGDYEGDGAVLGGTTDGGDIMAYLIHADVGYKFDKVIAPVLWFDYLSGDSDHSDDDHATFDRMLGYGRKLYGRSDRFLFIPQDTQNGGLIDLAIKNRSRVGPGNLDIEYHYFLLAQENLSGDEGQVGTDFNVTYTFPVWEKVAVQVGSYWFLPLGDFRDEMVGGQLVETDGIKDYHYVQLDLQLP
jgi:hypothetical protein